MSRRGVVLAAVAVTALLAASAQPAAASRYLQVGLFDDAQLRYATTDTVAELTKLHVQVARLTLYWGGPQGVARRQPAHPGNPSDPAYDWSAYDAIVKQLHAAGIQPLLGILGTPPWENKSKGLNVAPANASDLREFAYAAALRYSGTYVSGGETLPAVREWLAWNEPNNPVFLKPQYRRAGSHWVIASARAYAQICNAIYNGVHSQYLGPLPDEHVACGVTGPKGNDAPATARASVDPLTFLTAAHKYGMKTFDVYAHHPYADIGKSESPTFVPKGKFKRRVQLGNINTLLKLVSQYYGPKHLWITEYGYQTNPPDKTFGVPYQTQAKYLSQSYAIARKNPRIDMLLWFLVRDEPAVGNWQSGLMTTRGKHKPAWAAYLAVPRG